MVLPLSQPISLDVNQPHNLLMSRVAGELQEVVLTQLSYDTSPAASSAYFRYTQRHGGVSRNVIEVSLHH